MVKDRRKIVGSMRRTRSRVGTGTEGAYGGSKTIPRHRKGGGKVWKGEGKLRDKQLTSPQAMKGLQVRSWAGPASQRRPRPIRPVNRRGPSKKQIRGQAMISGTAIPATKQKIQRVPIKQYKPKPRRIPKPRTTTKPSY